MKTVLPSNFPATIHASYTGRSEDLGRQVLSLKTALEKKLTQCDRQVSETRATLARKIRTLRAESKKRGYLIGLKEAQSELQNSITSLQTQYRKLIGQAEQECLRLALRVAEEVIGKTMDADHNGLADRIARALKALADRHLLKITANPKDTPQLLEKLENISGQQTVNLESSADIEPGNALIETNCGCLKLDWRNHFKNIQQKLEERIAAKLKAEP